MRDLGHGAYWYFSFDSEESVLLFRVSQMPTPVGSVVPAGNFGRMFDLFTLQNVADDELAPWRLASEMVVEKVRVTEFPNRPSRLACSFAWLDEATARWWASQLPGSRVQVVEALDVQAKQFVGDYELMSSTTRCRADVQFLPTNTEIARRYWSGSVARIAEVLIESDLRVVEALP